MNWTLVPVVSDVFLRHETDVDCWGNIDCKCGAVFYEDIKHPGKADEEHRDHLVLKIVEAVSK